MVMIDGQTVRGGRAGPTFHSAGGRGGRTIGAKRSIVIEILGLPVAVRVAKAWLEVAAVAYMFAIMRSDPT